VGVFDRDEFVAACGAALAETDVAGALREVMARAVADPASIAATIPVPVDPRDDGTIHRSADLFVTYAVFPRRFRTGLHDHRMPAVIGAWSGYEDNRIFRRAGGALEPVGVTRVEAGDVLVLGADAVHDVHAPSSAWTGALHVYLGDLIGVSRSEWAAADAPEAPFDGAAMERRWTEAAIATGLAGEA
jgi:predicted metal-dependent enzyme (double-stranded beta helix superfamily)